MKKDKYEQLYHFFLQSYISQDRLYCEGIKSNSFITHFLGLIAIKENFKCISINTISFIFDSYEKQTLKH